LDAANRVFAEHEVDVATTTMIAKQAGVSVGALYRFFEDKSALALALTERWFLDFVAIIQRVDALIDADGIDAMEDAMAAIIEGIGDFSRDNPSYFAVMRHLRNHKLRELQIDKLAQWFEVSPENLDYDDRYRLGLSRARKVPPRDSRPSAALREVPPLPGLLTIGRAGE